LLLVKKSTASNSARQKWQQKGNGKSPGIWMQLNRLSIEEQEADSNELFRQGHLVLLSTILLGHI
jgi:hypothetical protein